MEYRRSAGSHVFDAANVAFTVVLIFAMIYPFVYVFSLSVSDPERVSAQEVMLFPRGFDLLAYRIVFSTDEIPRAFLNSVYYTALTSFCTLVFVTLTAYPLAQRRLKGKGIITVVFVLTMFLPAGLVPQFLLIQNLGLMNTVWALVLPVLPVMWYIIITRTYFRSLPEALVESAYIDGANDWRILLSIVLPLSKPILATIGLFAAVGMWNNFFSPLLYLSDQEKYPLSIVLRKIVIQGALQVQAGWVDAAGAADVGELRDPGLFKKIQMATIIVAVGPILVVYPFVQKHFVKGVLIGSLKG